VVVSPRAAQLAPGAVKTFACQVTGTPDVRCAWAVEGTGGGTITATGEYAAPAAETTDRVVATSVADPSKSDAATVVVMDPSTPGVWRDVTPPGFVNTYGAQDILVNPQHPNVLYAFGDRAGCWRSDDFGETFTKQSNDAFFESGGGWGEAIAPDGSYMLACSGYGAGDAWRSESKDENGVLDGKIWTQYSMAPGGTYSFDVYNFDIDPNNVNHVLACGHNDAWLKESNDGGKTWTMLTNPGWGASSYVFFITSSTWLVVSAGGTGAGTWQTTNSGASWSLVGPTLTHLHGETQYVDVGGGVLFLATDSGIHKSPDSGATWSRVSSQDASGIAKTATTLYATAGFPNAPGSYGPSPQRASLASGGVTWTNDTPTVGMIQGAKRMGVTFDGSRHVIVSGNWNAGIWRFIEP